MKTGRSEPLASRCRVERGLYLLRYIEAAGQPCPRAEISFGRDQLRIVTAPGRDGAALSDPGQVLVLVAREPCEFELKVFAVGGGGTDARFGLDLLDEGRADQGWTPERDGRPSPENAGRIGPGGPDRREDREVAVLAHVSRRGDVRVGADAWIAGPDEVLQIEGLAVTTGRRDLGVRVRVQTARGGQQWSRWCEAGEFAGSRQQANPLIGIAIALEGEEASHFEVSADVMALGSPPQTKTGRAVEFCGPDPIVGFRFRLNPVKASAEQDDRRSSAPLRVFRARG